MPSPTRRNRSKSPANRTRRNNNAAGAAVSAAYGGLMAEMAERPWANVAEEYEARMGPRRRVKAPSPPSPPTMDNDALEDYRVPDLRLRKAIWENFPVDLKAIPSANGTERYAITWNGAKLREWRDSRSESFDEYQDYKDWQEIRLMHALEKHSHKYRIEAPRSDREIAVIAMVHDGVRGRSRSRSPKAAAAKPAGAAGRSRSRSRSPKAAAARRSRSRSPKAAAARRSRSRSPKAAVAAKPAAAAYAGPVLRKLNDITTYFPGVVVWKSVAGRAGESTYALSVRGDFMRRVPAAEARRTLDALMGALHASRFWTVLAPVGDEFVRLEMRHD